MDLSSNVSRGRHSNQLRKKNNQEVFQARLLVPQHLHLVDEHHLQHPHPHHPPHLPQHAHISEGAITNHPNRNHQVEQCLLFTPLILLYIPLKVYNRISSLY